MSLPLSSGNRRRREQHRMTKTRVYKIWAGMVARCRYESATGFHNYGGKGVQVCERRMSFTAFYADMGDPPEGMSLERKDGAVGYEPSNCKWATRLEQNRNHHDLMFLTLDGRTQCLSAWVDELGLPYAAIRGRIKRGWDAERALRTPIRAHKPYERRAP